MTQPTLIGPLPYANLKADLNDDLDRNILETLLNYFSEFKYITVDISV